MMERISAHISYAEATKSKKAEELGIDNTPGAAEIANMKLLAESVFEPLRLGVGKPIRINSMFRSIKVDEAVAKGMKKKGVVSQHSKGEAMDIVGTGGVTNAALFNFILKHLPFDQLIWEFGTATEPDWVHVSYTSKRTNRKQVLRGIRTSEGVSYQLWQNQ